MNYSEIPAIEGFIRLCHTGWELGLHERNGGNLSYRMTREDISACTPLFRTGDWVSLPESVPSLAGEHFIVTGSGRYMQNVEREPLKSIGIIELDGIGAAYRVLWGLVGAKPTSELISHLLCHSAAGKERPVMYHCHPACLVAMSHILPAESRDFTLALWKSMTECPIAIPKGVGVLPWITPGSAELGRATSALLDRFTAVIWALHGLFVSGRDFDDAIGAAHTLEKTADIYLKILSTGKDPKNFITDGQLISLSEAYDLGLELSYLNL